VLLLAGGRPNWVCYSRQGKASDDGWKILARTGCRGVLLTFRWLLRKFWLLGLFSAGSLGIFGWALRAGLIQRCDSNGVLT